MKTPKLYQWAKDGYPPVDITDFFSYRNARDLINAYSALEINHAKMHKALKEVKSDINIVGEVSKKTLEKINSILKELK